jgi:hypothetical protein
MILRRFLSSGPRCRFPASLITSLARGLDALRSTPTLTTSNRSPVSFRRKPSAIKLRVAFPVERNRTFGLCLVISLRLFGPTVSHPYAGRWQEGRQFYLAQSLEINLALRRELLSIAEEPSRTRCPVPAGANDHGIGCAGRFSKPPLRPLVPKLCPQSRRHA